MGIQTGSWKYLRWRKTTSKSAKWNVQPNTQVHLLDLKRLSKKTTSRAMRKTHTAGRLPAPGVVAIFSGAGVLA
jgi:hypothetical protein